MKTVTVDQVLAWKPCYPPERIREIYAGRETWTFRQIVNEIGPKFNIPTIDLIWTGLHPEFITDQQMRLLACKWATAALERERNAGREPDARSWAAVEVSSRFANGHATETELAAAEAAAWEAARASARGESWLSAAAAWASARGAAWLAAWEAAWAAKLNDVLAASE